MPLSYARRSSQTNTYMPLNRNAYLAGALLLIVGVLPHRVRQNAHFGLFFRLYALPNRFNCRIGWVTLPHFVTQNVFYQCVVLSRLVALSLKVGVSPAK